MSVQNFSYCAIQDAASFIGSGWSVQRTTRPSLVRSSNPAFSSTRKCFMKPGKDMSCSPASSVTG